MPESKSNSEMEKETSVSARRVSHMSVEAPLSPVSSSADSISETSEHERHNRDYPEKALTPHISHTSSIGAVGGVVPTALHQTHTNRSVATTATNTDPAFEIDFAEDDRGNPRNWALWYKALVLFYLSYTTTCVVLYATSYTSAIPGMMVSLHISDTVGNLGLTTYLLGMATGAVVLAPLSEMYGRRPIYIVANAIFIVLVLPCALAKNAEAILVTRFFGAFCAAAMISNAPGSVNDVVTEEYRALAFSVWSIGPMNGPVFGPLVGGFVEQYLGWRWTNWVVMIVTSVAWILISLVPETYGPAILRKRAAKKRKETGDSRWWSRYDDKQKFFELLKINLIRPFVLTVTEPICIFWDVYIALVYGILYLCFVAYPIVFEDLRGWSAGITGLSFTGLGVGGMIVIVCEPLIRKFINSHKPDPETGVRPPEAMVSVVCIAALLIPAGELWFAWTCTPNVHWAVPIVAGVPFGAGTCAVFIYATSYLVHAYGIYAASALAGNAVLRSVAGATLPLAGPAMYSKLGANWAGTLLGLLEALCIPIPFIFYRYGKRIRERSTLIREMQEDKERQDAKRRKAEQRMLERSEAEAMAGVGMETGAAVDEVFEAEQVEKDLEKGEAGRVSQ